MEQVHFFRSLAAHFIYCHVEIVYLSVHYTIYFGWLYALICIGVTMYVIMLSETSSKRKSIFASQEVVVAYQDSTLALRTWQTWQNEQFMHTFASQNCTLPLWSPQVKGFRRPFYYAAIFALYAPIGIELLTIILQVVRASPTVDKNFSFFRFRRIPRSSMEPIQLKSSILPSNQKVYRDKFNFDVKGGVVNK